MLAGLRGPSFDFLARTLFSACKSGIERERLAMGEGVSMGTRSKSVRSWMRTRLFYFSVITLFTGLLNLGAEPQKFEQANKKAGVDGPSLSFVEKLERGEIFSARMATSFIMQSLIKQDPTKIQAAMNKDLVKFARAIPDLAFVRAFKTSDDKKMLYLKLRGFGGGTGALVEVLQGFDEAFKDVPVVPISGRSKILRPSGASIANPWESRLTADVEKLSKESNFNRTIGSSEMIRLIGPLHESFALDGVRVEIQIAFRPYTIQKKPPFDDKQIYTLFTTQVSFVPVVPKRSLGDFAGFGERKLVTAEFGAQKFLSSLRDNLERIK